jgi:hypothetical protein
LYRDFITIDIRRSPIVQARWLTCAHCITIRTSAKGEFFYPINRKKSHDNCHDSVRISAFARTFLYSLESQLILIAAFLTGVLTKRLQCHPNRKIRIVIESGVVLDALTVTPAVNVAQSQSLDRAYVAHKDFDF